MTSFTISTGISHSQYLNYPIKSYLKSPLKLQLIQYLFRQNSGNSKEKDGRHAREGQKTAE